MKNWLMLAVLGMLALTTSSFAADEQVAFKYGIGVFNSADKSYSEVKIGSLSYQKSFFHIFTQQYEVGFWSDTRKDLSRNFSGYGNYSLGITVDPGAFYLQSLWGLGFITHTDSMLGGNFQFNQDLGIGFKDGANRSIGLHYKHISSAGIFLPNKGRDFLMIRIGFPVW